MPLAPITLPAAPRFVLANARVPRELVAAAFPGARPDAEGCIRIDTLIEKGQVAALAPAGAGFDADLPRCDLAGRLVWPAFADMHTRLDKGM